MRADWELLPIGDVFQTVTGNTPPKRQSELYGGEISFIKPPELLNKKLSNSKDHLSELDAEKARIAPIGSVLVSCIGNLGKIGFVIKPVAFNQQINAIFPNIDKALPEYVFYFSQSPKFLKALHTLASGTTVSIVNKTRFNTIKIPLPPLEEQKRIVEVLDKAFEGLDRARQNTEANLASAKELFESALQKHFDNYSRGIRKEISSIAIVKGGKRIPKGHKLTAENTGFPYVSVKNFNDQGSIDVEDVMFVPANVQPQIARYTISSQDLYVSIAGTIGKTGIVPPELCGANLTENAAKLTFVDEVLNHYVYFFTRTPEFREQALAQTRTTAQPKLALSRLEQIVVPVPSVADQRNAISLFERIDSQLQRTRRRYSQKLKCIDQLRQSILQRAFAGELT